MITVRKYNSKDVLENREVHYIVWVERAAGVVTINDKDYPLSNNNILVIGAHETFDFISTSIEGIVVSCSDADFPKSSMESVCRIMLFYSQHNVINHIVVVDKNVREFGQLFYLMLNEHLLNSSSTVPVLSMMLHTLMLKLEQYIRANVILEKNKSDIEEELVSSFLEHLEHEYRTKHKVSEYADLLNISTRKLNDSIKVYFGTTTKDLISHKLYIEIARLLQFSSASVKEIAYRLGYKSPHHLTSFFSKENGASPLEYRNKFKNA